MDDFRVKLLLFFIAICAVFFLAFKVIYAAPLTSLEVNDYNDLLEYTEIGNDVHYRYTTNTIDTSIKSQGYTEIDRTETSITYYIDDKRKLYKLFPSKQFEKTGDVWRQVDYATTTTEIFYNELDKITPPENLFDKLIGLLEFYPAIAQTSYYLGAGDGNVQDHGTWATVQSATNGDSATYTSINNSVMLYRYADGDYTAKHAFLPVDTSAIEDGYDIDSADIKIWPTQIDDYDTTSYACVHSTQATDTVLVIGDYDAIGSVRFCSDFTAASLSTAQYNTISLNASGRAEINDTGYSHFAFVQTGFLDNSESEWSGDNPPASTRANEIIFRASEYTGTANDPYIEIVASEPAAEPATSTTIISDENWYSDDLTIVSGRTDHYESSTTVPDWTRYHSFHIPFLAWVIIFSGIFIIGSRIILEIIIRFRNGKLR